MLAEGQVQSFQSIMVVFLGTEQQRQQVEGLDIIPTQRQCYLQGLHGCRYLRGKTLVSAHIYDKLYLFVFVSLPGVQVLTAERDTLQSVRHGDLMIEPWDRVIHTGNCVYCNSHIYSYILQSENGCNNS